MSVGEYNPSDIAKLQTMQREDSFLGSFAEQELNRRTTLHKELRAYEVSLWTLQDEFITVLKWSDVEQQGRIQSPKMTLNVDGTQKFTFSMPMYLYTNEDELKYFYRDFLNTNIIDNSEPSIHLRENPSWYSESIKNKLPEFAKWEKIDMGKLMTGMRKLKVIFNKKDIDEGVFEFVITQVTEDHESDKLMCQVESEGLAFHELGKVGYKINLSQDNYLVDYDNWADTGSWTKNDGTQVQTEPKQTVQYWCEKCNLLLKPQSNLNPNQWYYDIRMSWSSSESLSNRVSNKVYEEPYVSSWNENLAPSKVESAREKERPVSVDGSNIYNITQTIAETFQIYCRYEYGYDDNYHIISRTIVFYNNYIKDNEKTISLSYPYHLKNVSRTLDSTQITTKMYVPSQDDSTSLDGVITIMNSPANPSQEEYLLDFDYMYAIGAIDQDQYDAVKAYELDMHEKNEAIKNLALELDTDNAQKIDLEADIKILNETVTLADEQITGATKLYNNIDADDGVADGYFTRDGANHYTTLLKQDSNNNQYYITFNPEDKGIDSTSIKVYRDYSASANPNFSNEISLNSDDPVERDTQYQDVIRANMATDFELGNNPSKTVHVTYRYKPRFYYEKVITTFVEKKNSAESDLSDKELELAMVKATLTTKQLLYDAALRQKKDAILAFEQMMGPALREGYWQPEKYTDYGDSKNINLYLPSSWSNGALIQDAEDSAIVNWDTELFSDESKNYYEESVTQEKHYYPCINLTSYMSDIKTILANNKKVSFIFQSNYYKSITPEEANQIQNLTNFTEGGKAEFGFIKLSNNNVIPVLILTGAGSMTDEQIKFMLNPEHGNPRIGVFETPVSEGQVSVAISNSNTVSLSQVYWYPAILTGVNDITLTETVYPRIKFSDTRLKTSENNLYIKYNTISLKKFIDYYVLARTTTRDFKAYLEYFVTLKAEPIIKNYLQTNTIHIDYVLSNAATSIYLDAKTIMYDSSRPKVSYKVGVNILSKEYIRILYKMLTQLVMINDVELKFNDVFGYISQVELDLDQPQNDTIEVKNYKTKFEDLFSTIVAQTEAMKRNETGIAAAAGGDIALSEDALAESIEKNPSILQAFFDSYFDSSEVVKERLSEIFTEAAEILSDANKSLNNLFTLNSENASILNGFVSRIQDELTPKVFTGPNQPVEFKTGDVWNQTDASNNIIGRYVATAGSDSAAGGFTRTFDGSLASITGASLNVDAVAGTVDILAQNHIDMKSGGNIYIAANEKVDIVGNKEVNIGGTTINIAASTNGGTVGGINIVATRYDNVTDAANSLDNTNSTSLSKVLIHPTKVELGAADILMRGANKIQMVTSRGTTSTTSAIEISPDTGVWIGSGQGVRLFSGGFSYNATTNTLTKTAATGASVELNSEHLILGFSNVKNNNGTAIEMTEDFMIIAAGNNINHAEWESGHAYTVGNMVIYNNIHYRCHTAHTSTETWDSSKWTEYGITGTSSGLVGAKFTKDSIGFATGSGANINAILMNNDGVTFGSGSIDVTKSISELRQAQSGSYVRIAGTGVEIGSTADLYINTNNFKLQTNAGAAANSLGTTILAIGTNLNGITSSTNVNTLNNSSTVSFLINDTGAFVKGYIYADGGSFTGSVDASSFIARGTNGQFIANDTKFGLYKSDGTTGILTADNSGNITAGENLSLTSGKTLTLSGASLVMNTTSGGTIDISSDNFKVKSAPNSGENYFYVGDTNNTKYIRYTQAGVLEVKGTIYAEAGKIGSQNSDLYEIYNEGQVTEWWAYNGAYINQNVGRWEIRPGSLVSHDLFKDSQYVIPGHEADDGEAVLLSTARMISNPIAAGDTAPDAWTMGTYTNRVIADHTDSDNHTWYKSSATDAGEELINYSFFTHGGCLVSNHPTFSHLYYSRPGTGEVEIDLEILRQLAENWETIKSECHITNAMDQQAQNSGVTDNGVGIIVKYHNSSKSIASGAGTVRSQVSCDFTNASGEATTITARYCKFVIDISTSNLDISSAGQPSLAQVLAKKPDGSSDVITCDYAYNSPSTHKMTIITTSDINKVVSAFYVTIQFTKSSSSHSGSVATEFISFENGTTQFSLPT